MRDALLVHSALTDYSRPPADLALLRAACMGLDTHSVDLNLRAFHELMSPERVADMVATGEARISAIVKRASLGFWEQQELVVLAESLADGIAARDNVGLALETFRDKERFFTRDHYQAAVKTTEAVLRLASALTYPFVLSAQGIKAPFSVFSEDAVARFRAVDPFRAMHEKFVADADARAIVLSIADAGQFLPSCALAASIREKKPDTLIVACGPWVEQVCADGEKPLTLLHAFFDAVITTDPERLLPALLADKEWKAHQGIAFSPRAKVSGKAKAHAALDVATLAAPDFSDLPLNSYPTPEPVLTFRGTRDRLVNRASGNWWGFGKKERRVMPPSQAAEQVRGLAQKHEARMVALTGDAYEISWLARFAEALGGGIKWCAEAVLDQPVDNAEALKANGCVALVLCAKDGVSHDKLGRAVEVLAHAGIAVQLFASAAFPENEDQARESLAVLKSHQQEIDLVNVVDGRLSVDPKLFGAVGTWLNGDGVGTYLDYAKLAGAARERINDELTRLTQGYAVKRAPFAGAAGSTHSFLGFDRFGRRVFTMAQRAGQQAQGPRPLSDGDRVRLSETAKMLWIPYQLSVFDEIAREETELREHDLLRRQKDIGSAKTWTYSDRADLKLRAQQRTPHVLGPGMPVTEISFALADLLAHIGEQFLPVSQLLAKAPREMKDALRRQLQSLYTHGALVSEAQARQHDRHHQGPQPNHQQQANHGGAPGTGRRRRRRRRGGRGGVPGQTQPQN